MSVSQSPQLAASEGDLCPLLRGDDQEILNENVGQEETLSLRASRNCKQMPAWRNCGTTIVQACIWTAFRRLGSQLQLYSVVTILSFALAGT